MVKAIVKWSTYFLVMLTIIYMYSATCSAAESNEDADSVMVEINVIDFGADGTDNEDDSAAFVSALAVAKTSEVPIKVHVPAGTYYIDRGLSIYSNTFLSLDANATIIGTNLQGAMLIGRHLNDDGTVCDGAQECTHGGYSQIQNITVSGGTWDRNDVDGNGNNTILVLRHGSNIVIENLTCKNATNHFINLSGVQNSIVDHVVCENMATYTGDDSAFWGNNEIGSETRYAGIEAIHLDYINDEGEPEVYPNDNTSCSSVTVSNCVFRNVYAGIGTHHMSVGERASNIAVKNCIFSNVSYHCINLYDFESVSIEDNNAEQVGVFVYSVRSNIDILRNMISCTNMNAVYFSDNSVINILENTITDSGEAGIRADGNCELYVDNNEINTDGTHGISVSNQTKLNANTNTITAPNGSGIYMGNACSGTLTGNQIENVQTAININTECIECKVENNVISSTINSGIYVSNESEATISGNTVINAGDAGINGSGNSSLYVNNNTITTPETHGICVNNNTILEATANTITAPNGSGIYMGNSCSGILSSNQIENVQTGINIITNCMDCIIQDNDIRNTVNNAIYLTNEVAATIDGNIIFNAGTAGIRGDGKCRLNVSNNEITQPNTHGVSVANGTELTANDNIISECGGSGFYINGSCSGSLSRNTIESTTEHAVYIYDKSDIVLENNLIQNSGNVGIRANVNCTVTANTNNIIQSGSHGISVGEGSLLLAMGNTIMSPNNNGIYLTNGDNSTISGNEITQSGSAGIYVSYTNGCLIDKNKVTGSASHAIIAVGNSATTCTVSITNNTAITASNINYDIRLSTYCKDCTVTDNVIGDRGVSIDATSTCIESNNEKANNNDNNSDELAIIAQPQNVEVDSGVGFVINIEATGSNLSYQWYYKKVNGYSFNAWSGKTRSTLSATANDTYDGMQVYCVVTDGNGDTVTSDIVVITINSLLAITRQPQDVVVAETGDKATIGVEAKGEGLTYLWYYKNPGGSKFAATSTKTASYTLEITEARDGRQMYCVVTDKYGNSVTSNIATMSVAKPSGIIITQQPQNVTIAEGDKFSFSIGATGNNLSYQWYYKKSTGQGFSKWTGKTSASFSSGSNATYDGMQVYCVVTDADGNSVTSDVVTISIKEPADIIITQQPQNVMIAEGDKFSFSIGATGNNLSYQWYYKKSTGQGFSKWTGKTSASFSSGSNATYDGMQVYCVVTDADGNSVTSDVVTISIKEPAEIIITQQPQNVMIAEGDKFSFSIEATGNNLSYQWYYKKSTGQGFSKWTGKTSASFSSGSNATYDGMQVYCVVTDVDGNSMTSDVVTISIKEPAEIIITQQPQNVTIAEGDKFSFSIGATGNNLSYQWYYKKSTGQGFSKWTGKTSASFSSGSNATYDGMQVYCVVTDADGNSVTSDVVTISIKEPAEIIITQQPQNVTIAEGDKFSFSIEATGNNLSYQWYYKKSTGQGFSKWTGKTSASFSSGSNATYDGMQVYCVVTDADGNSVTSDVVTISIKELADISVVRPVWAQSK